MGLEAFPWQGSQGARKPAAIERIFPQPPANCPNALHGKFYSFESRCGCFPVVSFKNASLSERSNMLTKGQHSCLRMNEFITLVSPPGPLIVKQRAEGEEGRRQEPGGQTTLGGLGQVGKMVVEASW